ncbi:hypothetical protein SAMN03159512_04723 [Pseudomonas sp. NFR09]|uniref:hypothetical protein n=1 Tax=Pseudomonas sp. NFR09 TaxID=1566249 RepID=UPI0008D28ECB|nr:hypothetical protein [Pseudomonas sp. NFR09]SEU04154.1 hypothetical protein SAMN03159512_04723 [Pseudomonas sp. NFR09]
MKLPMTCFECFHELNTPQYPVWVEYQDSHLYEFECPNGHKSHAILQQQKLEVLFSIGMHAITDGYYREAVASFASSLERFYEFFIKVKLLHEKIDSSAVTKSWKNVAQQSERQLGAFILFYTQTFNEEPLLLSQSNTKFRNAVIHKGLIPTKQEAIDFGQAVLDVINPIAEKMTTKFKDAIIEFTFMHIYSYSGPRSAEWNPSTMNSPSLLNVSSRNPGYVQHTVADGLEHLIKMKGFGAIR